MKSFNSKESSKSNSVRKSSGLNQHTNLPLMKRGIKHFPTGSSYEGTWSVLGMSGYGVYTFPDGVKYEGEFADGEFHGNGKMTYPNGCILMGKWENGELQQRRLNFPNGLKFEEENWMYLQTPDRRYTSEFDVNIKPAGESHLSEEEREIPLAMYDAGYGFFDPRTQTVYDYDDISRAISGPTKEEQEVIKKTCRCNPIRPLGPRQDLYEEWQEPLIDQKDPDGKWTNRTGSTDLLIDPNRSLSEPPLPIERCKKRTIDQIISNSPSFSIEGGSNLSKILQEDSDTFCTFESVETSENLNQIMKIKEEGPFKVFYS